MDVRRDTFDSDEYGDVRLYWDAATPEQKLASVTTIIGTRDDDKSALHDWQDRNDGTGDNPDHRHLFFYSRHRGTLCHWYALKTLDPDLSWSPDEAQSRWALGNISSQTDPQNWPETHDARPRDVLYSVLRNRNAVTSWGEFYDAHPPENDASYFEDELVALFERDRDFFVEAFERVMKKLSVDSGNVLAVEQYLFEKQTGYAGQVDLVYQDGDDTVVTDLKTSSGCYAKHKLQAAAYGKAIERSDSVDAETVNRLEVIRIHPDSGQYAVHSGSGQQGPHTDKYWNKSYETLWDEFEDLATSLSVDIE